MPRRTTIVLLILVSLFTGYSCKKSDSQPQCPNWTIYFPNAFEPTGNGINNTFAAKGTGIDSYEMWIYDNNNSLIYHCTNIDNAWNGTVNNIGLVCPQGAYFYTINATDACGYKHTYNGSVLLIK